MSETKRCPGYGQDPHQVATSDFYRNLRRHDGLSGLCIECHNREVKARSTARRLEAIGVLGGRCQSPSCAVPGGMADVRALQFDHIKGGGNARQRAGENGHSIIKAILGGSTEFQLLCANCNWIKKFEQNEAVGHRIYTRILAERIQGTKRSPEQSEAIRTWWARATPEERETILAKRSAARQVVRQIAVEREIGTPDPTWERHDPPHCLDCQTVVKPHVGRGLCNACYMRDYDKRKRESS